MSVNFFQSKIQLHCQSNEHKENIDIHPTMTSTYPALELQAVVGFGGKVPNGLLCHPDGVHLIYPLGSTIVVKNTVLGTQTFLQGHSNMVSCMELSRDGAKLASGQVRRRNTIQPGICLFVAMAWHEEK